MPRQPHAPAAAPSLTELSVAGLRMTVAAILIWGALTKLAGGERIAALAAGWAAEGIPEPHLFVTASVALQLALASLLLVGLFTRAAGLLSGVNFAVAAAASGLFTAGANWWAFALLVVLLLHFGARGAGPISLDRLRARRLAAAASLRESSLEGLLASMGIAPRSESGEGPARR